MDGVSCVDVEVGVGVVGSVKRRQLLQTFALAPAIHELLVSSCLSVTAG